MVKKSVVKKKDKKDVSYRVVLQKYYGNKKISQENYNLIEFMQLITPNQPYIEAIIDLRSNLFDRVFNWSKIKKEIIKTSKSKHYDILHQSWLNFVKNQYAKILKIMDDKKFGVKNK